MIHGDLPAERQQYEGWHIHANLTTIRGFPWLFAATGDRSYLRDAIAACDRVWQRATWSTGGVLEQIPWAGTKSPGPTPDPHDEICQTSDLLQLSYLLAEFTGEGRFYDRAEQIYYNHIRYSQMHNGDFTAFNRLPGPQRGGDAWFCCGWWGAKALYEAARHLYASSPTAVYVNGFMRSSATLKWGRGSVRIDTEADLPKSPRVRIILTPSQTAKFDLRIRVPGWAGIRAIEVNRQIQDVRPENGYITLARRWEAGDRVDVPLDVPLRVVLDNSWDTQPEAKVALDGAAPAASRCVSVFRGPVIVAQFRLAHGCDLAWAYTGDHPDLLETIESASDLVDAGGWHFRSDTAPELTRVVRSAEGVRLDWQYVPHPGWTLKRTALVRPEVPVRIDYTFALTAPAVEAARAVKSARVCGVRMRTAGFVDYKKARLFVNGKPAEFADAIDQALTPGIATLDNGYVQFRVESPQNGLATADEGQYASIYAVPKREVATLKANYRLTVTGRSGWSEPIVNSLYKTRR